MGRSAAINEAKYKAAWEAYRDNPREKSVREATGVSRSTAIKLIEDGYPEVGMEPLAERLRRLRRKEIEQDEYSYLKAKDEALKAMRLVDNFVVPQIQELVVALRAGKRAGLEPKDRMTPAQLISMAVLVQQEKLKLLEDGKEKMQAGVNPALVELIQETIWEMSDDQIAFMMENNLLPWDEKVKQLRAATRIEGVIEGTIVPDDDKDEQKQ